MTFLHIMKRKYQKFIIRSKRKTTHEKTPKFIFEKEALQICRNIIHCPESKLLLSPDGSRRFIIYEPMQINIIIKDDQIILSNHTYYYELNISVEGIKSLIRIFDGHIQVQRDVLEQQITMNAKNTLGNIINVTSYLSN